MRKRLTLVRTSEGQWQVNIDDICQLDDGDLKALSEILKAAIHINNVVGTVGTLDTQTDDDSDNKTQQWIDKVALAEAELTQGRQS